jgi:hypothetical protein
MTTLADYYASAGLFVPEFAEAITLRFPPFKHQIGDLAHLAKFTRSSLLSEPGTGKTLPAQGYGLWLAGQGNKVVYTMPPMLTTQFYKSLASTYPGYEQFVSCAILQGPPKERSKLIDSWQGQWPDMLIMSYRMFVGYHEQLKDAQGYTCVIVDEANAVKNPGSLLHKSVKIFGGDHQHASNGIVLMTGSPIDTNLTDAYGLIALVTPGSYGSKRNFDRVHCLFNPYSPYPQILAYIRHDLLHYNLFLQGRRVKKADVSDLPPRLISEIPITLNRSHRQLYARIVEDRLAEIGDRVLDLTEQPTPRCRLSENYCIR